MEESHLNTRRWADLHETVINCRKCPRLVAWRELVALKKRAAFRDWDYWGRPIPGFGDYDARLFIVGLAPAAHGGNRTGRVFTGDRSGDFLFAALHRFGFANQPTAVNREDGLMLRDAYIAAVCRCAPPDNKPLPDEIVNCRPYLLTELGLLHNLRGIVALGAIAMDNICAALRARGAVLPKMKFGHGAYYEMGEGLPWLLASYHPSQQNTQTGRLTVPMFDSIWRSAREKLG